MQSEKSTAQDQTQTKLQTLVQQYSERFGHADPYLSNRPPRAQIEAEYEAALAKGKPNSEWQRIAQARSQSDTETGLTTRRD